MLESYFAIVAALLANFFAQGVKVIIHLVMEREWKPKLALSTGGMPSSHSATVSALATAVGLLDGFDSTSFAIAFIFTGVVAFDAMGVRQHAGRHAAALNTLMDDLKELRELMVIVAKRGYSHELYDTRFKELLGHKPLEVFSGLITGVLLTLVLAETFELASDLAS